MTNNDIFLYIRWQIKDFCGHDEKQWQIYVGFMAVTHFCGHDDNDIFFERKQTERFYEHDDNDKFLLTWWRQAMADPCGHHHKIPGSLKIE